MKTNHANLSAFALKSALAAAALALFVATSPVQAGGPTPPAGGIQPVGSTPYGRTYAEWSAEWFKLLMEQDASEPGNPILEGGCFPLSGRVWGLAAPFPVEADFECTVPRARSLFFPIVAVECSSLEEDPFHGATEEEQTECAKFWADHIVNLFVEIDGRPVRNLASHRVVSPQIAFEAPTPWAFGLIGGSGTSVADGYYLMLAPLSEGDHTIRVVSAMHFSEEEGDPFDLDLEGDVTFDISVE